jgi:hypothetical protein
VKIILGEEREEIAVVCLRFPNNAELENRTAATLALKVLDGNCLDVEILMS